MRFLRHIGLVLGLFGLLAALAGCVSVSAEAGVDADSSAYIKYRIACDMAGEDEDLREAVVTGLTQLAEYYGTMGFAAEHSYEGDTLWLEVTRRERRGSLEEAFAQLEQMLLDESISLFSHVDLAFGETEYHTAYMANVSFDVDTVLDSLVLNDVPYNLQQRYEEIRPEISSSLTLSIPGTEIIQAAGGPEQLEGFIQSKSESVDGPVSVYLSTVLSQDDAEAIRQRLLEGEPVEFERDPDEARLKQILWTVCLLCFAISFVCLVVLVVSILKRTVKK